MNIVKPVLTGTALAIAATLSFSATDSALAKTKKHEVSSTTRANHDETQRSSDQGGYAVQAPPVGVFYRSSHKKHHKAKAST
jgi:hypothetical protein